MSNFLDIDFAIKLNEKKSRRFDLSSAFDIYSRVISLLIHFVKQSQKQVRTTLWTRANFVKTDKSSKGPMSCLKAGQVMTSRIPTPLVMPDNNTLLIGYCVWSGLY